MDIACTWAGNLSEWRDHLRFHCNAAEGYTNLEVFVTAAKARMAGGGKECLRGTPAGLPNVTGENSVPCCDGFSN